MVEGQKQEEILEGVHPVLPSLALASKRMVATIERESGVAGMKWFLLTVLARRDGLSQGEFTQKYEMDPSRVTRTSSPGGYRDAFVGFVYREERGPQSLTARRGSSKSTWG